MTHGMSAASHRVLTAPMRPYHDPSVGDYLWYDLDRHAQALDGERFGLFLIDGPVGTTRYSRVGIVPAFRRLCTDEWLVIWDDLDRPGDLASFCFFLDQARAAGARVDCAFLVGMKTVGMAFTPAFGAARYYV